MEMLIAIWVFCGLIIGFFSFCLIFSIIALLIKEHQLKKERVIKNDNSI